MSHSYWHGGVWKALDRATRAHGFNTLLEKMASTTLLVGLTDKAKEKERKLIVEALALGLTVHPGMLARYGLGEQPPVSGKLSAALLLLYFSGGRDRMMTWDIHRNVRLRC